MNAFDKYREGKYEGTGMPQTSLHDYGPTPCDFPHQPVPIPPADEYPVPKGMRTASETRSMLGMINTVEMAAALRISHATLAMWRVKRRGPPFVKIGKRVFYLLNDFTSWVEEERDRQRGTRRKASLARVRREALEFAEEAT
jgi:hypothetical protein